MKKSYKELFARNILTNNKQQIVKGGKSGTCGYITVTDGLRIECNISKSEALNALAEAGYEGKWCCDSCASTFYCG